MLLSNSTYDRLLASILKLASTSTLKALNKRILFPIRRRYLTQILAPHLSNSRYVLDVGASDGKLAADLQLHLAVQHINTKIIGCDVHIQPQTHIPVIQYDGYHLPFPDNSFDHVLIVDVLHHTHNPLDVLREAARVSSQYLVIKDHYWSHPKDFISLKFADYIGNQPYGIDLPYGFLSEHAWKSLFLECKLTVVERQRFRYNLIDPCKHVLFRVKV